ncbi:MAG TPA: fructosamine kinase family protein [Longimicrobiales bacterium]|nr:fructosamine kinase family protein [Longimicrobiales bacterium]
MAAGEQVSGAAPVGGGCISPAFRLQLDGGARLFLKLLPQGGPVGLLRAEAHALRRIEATRAVRVPAIVAESARHEWLALEWLEPVTARDDTWGQLGQGVAELHRNAGPNWGWDHDNWIGTLPQANRPAGRWCEFWAERRLRPQLEMAASWFDDADVASFQRLFDALEDVLAPAEEDGPSLLHGDLWSGNVHLCADGAALIDPSSSYGHREVDLAMAVLFGGFPPAFFDAYARTWPLTAGASRRQAVYQLYYLLVHVNLFGAGYVARTLSTLRRASS